MSPTLKPLRDLYAWMLALGDKPYALGALAVLAFAESILFPLPLEVLLVPLILGARAKWLLFVGVAAVFSALGALVGGMLASLLVPYIGLIPGIDLSDLKTVQGEFDRYGVWAIAIGALTILPFKVTVIAAGLAQFSLVALFLFSFLFRGLRYALVGVILFAFGEQAKVFIDRWFGWLCLLGVGLVAVVLGFLASH